MNRHIRIERADAPASDWFGSSLRFAVRAADTGGRVSMHVAEARAGAETPPHCHGAEDEVFYVLDGAVHVRTPNGELSLGSGDLALVPRGAPHAVRIGDEGARLLTMLAPGQLEEAFMAIAADGSPERLRAEMEVWGVRILNDLAPFTHPLAPSPGPVRIVRAEEGERIWLAGDEYAIKVRGADTGGRFCIVHFRIPPGGGPPVHAHHAEEEIFHVIAGAPSFYADGDVVRGGPGDTVVLPRRIPHAFRNDTDDEAHFLAILSPAGFDAFIREAGTPATPGEAPPKPDHAEKRRLMAASANHDIQLFPDIQW